MDLAPSAAVILVPDHDLAALEDLLARALEGRRYVRRDAPPPKGWRVAGDEWLGFALDQARRTSRSDTEGRAGVVIPEALDQVFVVARWLSAALGDRPVVAWRRFMGLPPVLKVVVRGTPLFKDGVDPDHEVDWPVPTEPPADLPLPRNVGLPGSAAEVPAALGASLRPYSAALQAGARRVGWVQRGSPLAG